MTEQDRLLIAIRKIIRATDLYSKHLSKTVGLTTPQLMLLQSIQELGTVAISRLAEEMSLSQATVTTILDRLEGRGLIRRQRSDQDKRVVHALLTPAGRKVLASAPTPLQDSFTERFGALPDWERSMILAALLRVAQLMDAESLDASPMLDVGALDRPSGVER
ncbi:MAG: MarR family transcriptional regulator [Pseudomonadales bacterium]